jgi:hypothetical protein
MQSKTIAWRQSMVAPVCGIILALATPPALAWGAKGHRLTALVAFQLLAPSTKLRLKAILGAEDLATAALYLDIHKDALEQNVPGSRDWHYDDRPSCDASVPRSEYCPGGDCASVQLKRHYNVLIDTHASANQRRFAVRVIAHLAGDIHQPLHASDNNDAGGNGIKLKPASAWFAGQHANLHSAWDNDFVVKAFSAPEFKNKSELQIAKILAAQISAADKEAWRKGLITSWLAESYDKGVALAYGMLPGFGCELQDFGEQKIQLPAEYIDASVAIVPEQIKKAGLRLAAILNRAFSTDSPQTFVRADKF